MPRQGRGGRKGARRPEKVEPKPGERPCCKCRRPFKPTVTRRLLCETCFRHADDSPYAI